MTMARLRWRRAIATALAIFGIAALSAVRAPGGNNTVDANVAADGNAAASDSNVTDANAIQASASPAANSPKSATDIQLRERIAGIAVWLTRGSLDHQCLLLESTACTETVSRALRSADRSEIESDLAGACADSPARCNLASLNRDQLLQFEAALGGARRIPVQREGWLKAYLLAILGGLAIAGLLFWYRKEILHGLGLGRRTHPPTETQSQPAVDGGGNPPEGGDGDSALGDRPGATTERAEELLREILDRLDRREIEQAQIPAPSTQELIDRLEPALARIVRDTLADQGVERPGGLASPAAGEWHGLLAQFREIRASIAATVAKLEPKSDSPVSEPNSAHTETTPDRAAEPWVHDPPPDEDEESPPQGSPRQGYSFPSWVPFLSTQEQDTPEDNKFRATRGQAAINQFFRDLEGDDERTAEQLRQEFQSYFPEGFPGDDDQRVQALFHSAHDLASKGLASFEKQVPHFESLLARAGLNDRLRVYAPQEGGGANPNKVTDRSGRSFGTLQHIKALHAPGLLSVPSNQPLVTAVVDWDD